MPTYTVNSVNLAVVDRGRGLPVLLVHGFPLSHAMWNRQIEALSPQYRVIAPDLRGFGQSGVTPGTVTMEQFADDLAALLEAMEVGEPVVYAGLSMGGYIAWQFWRRHPGRLRALILCDTRAAADTPEAKANRATTAERVLAEGPTVVVESMMPRLLAPATLESRPDVVEALRGIMMANDPRGIAAASRGMGQRPDMTAELGRIRCPVLALVGALDVISPPAEMRSMVQAMPDARLVEIPGAGHMSPIERPAETSAAMLEFLRSLAGSGTATGS